MSTARIWTTFQRNMNGKEVKFRIQEIGAEQYEEILKLYLEYYMPEEPVHKTAGLSKSDEAIEEYKKQYLNPLVSEHCQIDACCVDDNSGALNVVAASIMYIDKKSGPKWDGQKMLTMLSEDAVYEGPSLSTRTYIAWKHSDFRETINVKQLVKTKQMTTFFEIVNYMTDVYYEFREKLDFDVFYDDIGIVVHKDYRGIGIAGEIFKARMVTCKELKVSGAGAWMTSIGSQKAAAKLGWETVLELDYKDLGKTGGVTFDEPVRSSKYMIMKNLN